MQQRVMMIMPIMFTAMFMWAPSGLVVYWFVSNLWAIGQQYFTTWTIGPPNTRPGKPVDGPKSAGRDAAGGGKAMSTSERIVEFVQNVVDAMGLELTASAEDGADGVRINLDGEGGGVLIRRQGEVLKRCSTWCRRRSADEFDERRRLVVDCMGYRREKDAELRQMAKFLAEKAKTHGAAQEIGPLNPYERRIVHMAVAEVAVGDLGEHRRRVREDGDHLGALKITKLDC